MRISLDDYCRNNNKEYLLEEWDIARNEGLSPKDVMSSSGKRVWRHCKHGHTWQTAVYTRSKQNAGCPYCKNCRAWPDYNDLASQCPELMQEWRWDLNRGIDPRELPPGSHKKAWWTCRAGHVWRTEIVVRAVGGHGCPICAGQGKHSTLDERTKKEFEESRRK